MRVRVLCVATMVGLLWVVGADAQGPAIKTVKPGVLTVAIDNDMPYCKEEGGKIIGVDGEIITAIATKLGLRVEPAVMEWAAEIQAASLEDGLLQIDLERELPEAMKPRRIDIKVAKAIGQADNVRTIEHSKSA